jgi:undecaprenyl-diphosphatase
MLEKVLLYEHDAFLALNGSHSAFWDRFMWLYSGQMVWMPLAVLILVIAIYKQGWRHSLVVLLSVALLIVLCDQLSSGIIKPLCCRLRPTHHPLFADKVVTVFGYRGGLYGFISGHATNAFGLATLFALLFRYTPLSWAFYTWATLTAYSRIYLGVHFISDIIPGVVAGIALGYLVHYLYRRVCRTMVKRGVVSGCPVYTVLQKRMITGGIALTILVLVVFNSGLVALFR